MNTLMARLALEWVSAERSDSAREVLSIASDAAELGRDADAKTIIANAQRQPPPTAEELAIASDHVHRVLAGEIRWSEASAGDKAIWKLRFRDVEKYLRWTRKDENIAPSDDPEWRPVNEFEPDDVPASARPPIPPIPQTANVLAGTPAPPPRRGPRLVGVRERLWWNYYDTLTIDENVLLHTRLFNNTNIGQFWRTNIMVGGMFPGDTTFVIHGYWATISEMSALGWFADNVMTQIVVGDRPASPQTFGRDLIMGVPLMPPYGRPYIVPVRQSYSVIVDLKERPPSGMRFDMTFHLDGLGTRDLM
jgi:hypothetical protein